jgi:hypothetical protein
MKVICPYCKQPAVLVTGAFIYPELENLHSNYYWSCSPCGAYVGTHRASKDHQPLGTMADKPLRMLRCKAHEAFDGWWKGIGMKRTTAYKELARSLGISKSECHIAMFDEAMCHKVVDLYSWR